MSDPKTPAPDDKQPRTTDAEPGERPAPKKPAALDYVFKIAPADPKNTLDFEDVADK